ncbi:PREDICTED: putative uncharacterized protein DDB_G0271606, partial [Rhagoletis zephyria]|uniref:putative uncharacterized protein DDB_G0271606 n=1 Tax=Rhagoletis zephyria TaxID=28612 RepID=UPI000811A1AB
MNSFNGPLSYGNNNKLIQSLINQYNGQYVQKPSTVYRSTLPSSSLQSLMNSITSGFNFRPIGRRSGKGSPLDNALYSLNAIPDSTGGNVGAPGEFNINNINAINEMISTALNTMNSAGGGNPMNPAGNAGVNSGLMSTVGSFLSSNIGKPSKKLLFEFPKAIYKSIGEKISGAGEAAVSATVPLKDSFFSTIKSFYSYLKPNRAGGGAQLTESNLAAAAAAAAAGFTGQSQDSGANSNGQSSSGNGGVFNFKRRQSMESPYVYHFAAAQPQITGGNGGNQRQQGNWQQQQQQQPQQQQQWNGNFANFQKQQQPSSNSGVQNSNSQFIHQAAVEQYNRQPVQFNSQQFDPTTSAQFNQALQQALFGMSSAESQQQQQPSSKVIPYGTRMQPLESQQIPVLHQHHQQQPHHSSGLYARSKELFNKIARKAAPRHPQPAQPAQPQIAQFPGQFLGSPAAPNQQLSSQILTKVQSKLGTLPTAYNQQQQVQQQQQPQSSSPLGQWTQSVLLSNPPSQPGQQSQWTQNTQQQTQQQQQQQPSSITSYYTQQPISQQQQQPSNGNQQQQSFSFQSDQSQQQSQQQQLGQYIDQLA